MSSSVSRAPSEPESFLTTRGLSTGPGLLPISGGLSLGTRTRFDSSFRTVVINRGLFGFEEIL